MTTAFSETSENPLATILKEAKETFAALEQGEVVTHVQNYQAK